jgi:long-chain fatty acid transport protein
VVAVVQILKRDLPSFESQVAVLPIGLTASGIPTSDYSMEAAFNGSSLNWGFQLNGSYAINDILSFSVGLRYIMAKNTYSGHLKNIMINPNRPAFGTSYDGTNMVLATQFFTDASTTLTTLSQGATAYASTLTNFVQEHGLVNLADAGSIDGISAIDVATMQAIITAAGQDPNVNLVTAQHILNVSAPGFQANANLMSNNAAGVADKSLDATQSGSGISPIFGMNIKFSDDLNFALKYEHKATIKLKNSTKIDDVGMFPDGEETSADMPSLLSMGLNYRALPALRLSGGFHYYFDKGADYGKKIAGEAVVNEDVIDKNFWEAAFGVEYAFTRSFIFSLGYLRTQTGVNDAYHSDLSHSLSTNSIGGGFKYLINPNLGLNLGVMTTMYEDYTKTFSTPAAYDETYSRKALTFGLGIDFRL